MALGSPLSHLFTDTSLAKLEKTKLKSVIDRLEHYYRYVVDMFSVNDAARELGYVQVEFSRAHETARFTTDQEVAIPGCISHNLGRRSDTECTRAMDDIPTSSLPLGSNRNES